MTFKFNFTFFKTFALYYGLILDKHHTKNNDFWIGFVVLDRGFTIPFNCDKFLCKVLVDCGCFWLFVHGFGWFGVVNTGLGDCCWFWLVVADFGWLWVVFGFCSLLWQVLGGCGWLWLVLGVVVGFG